MPRFNFASQTAATQTAATPTPVATEPVQTPQPPSGGVVPTEPQAAPTATVSNVSVVGAAPAPQPAQQVATVPEGSPEGVTTTAPTATPTQAQKAVAKLNELMAADALSVVQATNTSTGEERIQFTSSATDPEGLKKAAHWLSALNAEWVFEGTGKERTAKSASLPSVVFTTPEAAESAHEAARAKWEARKVRNEQYKAQKAAEQTPQPPLGGVATVATVSGGSVAGSSRTFSEAQVRALLKKANATLTAELIDILIKTA